MPLEVKIDVVPNDDEARRETLHTVRIEQVAQLDNDPDGWRRYEVSVDGGPERLTIEHRRSDGAYRLVLNALARLRFEGVRV